MPKSVFGRSSAPDPAGGAYDAPPDPLVGWRGHPSPYSTPFGTDPPSALAMRPPEVQPDLRLSTALVQTSVWLTSHIGQLCNKNCIIRRFETLIIWSSFSYTAGCKPGCNKRNTGLPTKRHWWCI